MIIRRTRDPAPPSQAPRVPLPHQEASLPARLRRLISPAPRSRARAPRGRAWPGAIALVALIVFIIFWVQTTVLMALITALATLAAGMALLTLIYGTDWIITPSRLTPKPRRRR
jgi:hypothetical protein